MSVPHYSPEELIIRIQDGSIDLNRLAATVAQMQGSVTALAIWANDQIQAQNQPPAATTAADDTAKRKR